MLNGRIITFSYRCVRSLTDISEFLRAIEKLWNALKYLSILRLNQFVIFVSFTTVGGSK
jgi:hypothetical protein